MWQSKKAQEVWMELDVKDHITDHCMWAEVRLGRGGIKKKNAVIPPLSNLLTPYISSRFSHPSHPTKGRTHRRWPHLHPSWHVPVGVHSCSGVHPRGAEALSGSSPLDRGPLCFRCHPPPAFPLVLVPSPHSGLPWRNRAAPDGT